MISKRPSLPRRAYALTAGCAMAAGATLAAATPTAAFAADRSTAHRGCRSVQPQSDFYEAGRVASEMLTVPASSRCTTISVRAITDPQNPADHCATFLIGFFPSEGEYFYTEPVRACSAGRAGPDVVLATDVPDGMTYRVLYEIDYLGQSLQYTIRH